jgi:hypothetical protein
MKINLVKGFSSALICLAFVSSAFADIECPAWQQLDVTQGLVQPLGLLAMNSEGLKSQRGGVQGCRVKIRATGVPQATRSYVASQLKLDASVVRFLISVNGLEAIEPQSPVEGGHNFTIAKIEFTKRINSERTADLFVSSYSNSFGEKRIRVQLKAADGTWLGGVSDVAASGLREVFEVRWERDPTCYYGTNADCTSSVAVYPSSGTIPSPAPLFQYVFPKPYLASNSFGIVPRQLVAGSQLESNLKFDLNSKVVPSLRLEYLLCYNNSQACILTPSEE